MKRLRELAEPYFGKAVKGTLSPEGGRRYGLAAFFLMLFCFSLLSSCAPKAAESPLGNEAEVIARLRAGLKNYASAIRVRFHSSRDLRDELPQLAEDWLEAALAETERAEEGDYLRFHCGGFEQHFSCEREGEAYVLSLEFLPRYYGYLVYEEATTAEVERLIRSFAFSEETGDYEKIRRVYDYLCRHVRYDAVHRKNPYYCLRSTAYAALVQGEATCQGYALALYRLLRELGISCRVIRGRATGERLHAWNIVELEGAYYGLDATWDAGRDSYRYFLKGSGDFGEHTAESAYRSAAFSSRYPLAAESYCPSGRQARAQWERKIS